MSTGRALGVWPHLVQAGFGGNRPAFVDIESLDRLMFHVEHFFASLGRAGREEEERRDPGASDRQNLFHVERSERFRVPRGTQGLV